MSLTFFISNQKKLKSVKFLTKYHLEETTGVRMAEKNKTNNQKASEENKADAAIKEVKVEKDTKAEKEAKKSKEKEPAKTEKEKVIPIDKKEANKKSETGSPESEKIQNELQELKKKDMEKTEKVEKDLQDKILENKKLSEDLSYYQFRTTQQITKLASTIEDKEKTLEIMTSELDHYKRRTSELDIINFEMRTLLKAGTGFSEILNLNKLLNVFIAVVQEKFGVKKASVLLYEELQPGQVHYQVKAYDGHDTMYMNPDGEEEELFLLKLPRRDGLLWQSIQQGDVLSVRDLQNESRFSEAFKAYRLDVLDADIWCPIIKNGFVLGILTLGPKSDGSPIEESEYQYIQDLSAIVATNIDSTLKFEKTNRILDNIKTLYDVNQQLANVQDFKKLCIETIKTACEAVKAQRANMMLVDQDTGKLTVKVVWGDLPVTIRDNINHGFGTVPKSFDIGEGAAGLCYKKGRTIRINDKSKIPQVSNQVVFAIMSVPMLRDGKVLGVINCTNKVKIEDGDLVVDTLERFTEEDEQLMFGLADQAATNLQKAKLYNASITDKMTKLFNTRHFEFTFDDLLRHSVKTDEPLALLITDIDKFKNFNDTYGHKAGDMVLKSVATCIAKSIRRNTSDICFRYGGEEFCMLLPNTQLEDALRVAESARKLVQKTECDYEGQILKVTISIGVAISPTNGTSTKEVFEVADKCLYDAKEGGRNQVRYIAASGEFEKYVEDDEEVIEQPAAAPKKIPTKDEAPKPKEEELAKTG